MKKLLTLILTAVLGVACVFGLTACGEKEDTLYVYTNAGFAPFEYVDAKGNVVGVDIDVMNEVGAILGYKIVVNDIDFANILTEVEKSEKAVGAAGITQKADRDAMALPTHPYFKSTQYVVAKKGTFDDGAKVTVEQVIAAVGSKKIGVQTGTTGADLVEKTNKDMVVGYTNAIVASGDIGATVGAVVIDKLPAKSIVKSKADELDFWEIDAEVEEYVLYFNKSQTELVKEVNKILDYMLENNVIDYLVAKHEGSIIGA